MISASGPAKENVSDYYVFSTLTCLISYLLCCGDGELVCFVGNDFVGYL